jgi:cell division protein FtsB
MMIRRATLILPALLTTTLLAQEPGAADLERRIRDLEARVQQLQNVAEIQREIDVLSREIEALKDGQQKRAPEANATQFGLGAAASKVYRSDTGVSIGGYGEFLYQNYRASGAINTADLLRGVLYTGYKFSDRALFNSELEVEHVSTERGGTVSLEFAYLDYLLRPAANVRAGVVLVPVGLINEQHEPTSFFGARRPQTETVIIPATWADFGVGVFGEAGRVSYRAFVVTGLDSAHFDAVEGIRGGRQGGGQAAANDLAFVGRADWHPFEGTMFGGSLYTGNSGQGRGFNGRVTLGELHADSKFRGVSIRALVARGTLGDAARINAANGVGGNESVGKSFGGWYVEGGYDLGPALGRVGQSISPYARYEQLDTQRSVPAGFARNPANDLKIFTLGVAWKPIAQTVIKADWQNVKNRARTGKDQFNIALGYIF